MISHRPFNRRFLPKPQTQFQVEMTRGCGQTPLTHLVNVSPAHPAHRELTLRMPISHKTVLGEAVHLECFQKWDLSHPSKTKEPLYATTSHNCWLHLDFIFFMLACPYSLSPQNLLLPPTPLSITVPYCPSHITGNLPV